MGKDHRGQPSGANRQEGTGLRPDMPEEKFEQDQQMSEKYSEGEDGIPGNIPVRHPNRNTDKGDATNAGGYKQ